MREDPLFGDAPAILRARRLGSAQGIEGTSCLEGGERPPIRLIAALIAALGVAMTSIWEFVFIDPYMPSLDPLLDYSWFVPTGPLFATVWLALTLMMTAALYLVLRAPESPARGLAIIAFIAQFILKTLWAWLLFGRQAPVSGLCVMVLFAACVIASIGYAARVDRKAALLMAPYVSWVTFILLATARIALTVG
jgi:tryptophan-rich sensory protein